MRTTQRLLVVLLVLCCCQWVSATTTAEYCSDPVREIPEGGGTSLYAMDSLYFDYNLTILEVTVAVQITHTWIEDLAIDVYSPTGTVVTLFDRAGGSADDIDVVFSDLGAVFDSESWVCACEVQPSGPGTLADFAGQASEGEWTITVGDFYLDLFAEPGTLDHWCVSATGCTIYGYNEVNCSVDGGTGTPYVFWDPFDPVPDELLLYSDNEVLASLPPDEYRYELDVDTPAGLYIYRLEAIDGDYCSTRYGTCGHDFDGVTVCREGSSSDVISYDADPVLSIVEITDSFIPSEVSVSVDLEHTWVGDLVLTVESPEDVTVTLFDVDLGSPDTTEDDMYVDFATLGEPHGSQPFGCSCYMEPVIAGSMDDLVGETAEGYWVLKVEDKFDGTDDGTFLGWCVTAYPDQGPYPYVNDPVFLRGDVDGNGVFAGLSDALYLLSYSFTGGDAPPCMEAADADGSGGVSGLVDALLLLNYAFLGGDPPEAPYLTCGTAAEVLIGCDVEPDCM